LQTVAINETNAMHPPVILTSFGTTSTADSTYAHLEQAMRAKLPDYDFYRAYSSREIRTLLRKGDHNSQYGLAELLQQLSDKGAPFAIVQSLHLLPGTEFHSLLPLIRGAPLPCSIGMPLLTDPADFLQFGEILQPAIAGHSNSAILILGHGTIHPSWTAYCALEKILREQFGERVFVGVVEKFPDSTGLIRRIHSAGFRSVCVIPLFLVAGMHYRRDILGPGEQAWLPRLEQQGMQVSCLEHGVGLLSGIENLIGRHIQEARNRFIKT